MQGVLYVQIALFKLQDSLFLKIVIERFVLLITW